jgi:hypothetical protein
VDSRLFFAGLATAPRDIAPTRWLGSGMTGEMT